MIKDDLHAKLRESRATLLAAVDGLSEYDVRRPMTPTGTNLLGLVKHLVGIEHVYLGVSFGRAAPDVLPWVEDGSVYQGADMWATADQSTADILRLYDRACQHSDETVVSHDIDSPGQVPHWPEERADTTLGFLLVRMVAETAQHAGHAEILRETIDGRTGSDTHDSGTDWPTYLAQIRAAADVFKP
ncbi:DinB family protein [Aeromicrobium sp. UC242_57]|uniref:DinB family protein n=1 Tax=Aeromicrobium sp. UC242_57 TaxID=3374624 RepID=UPI0037A4595E